MPIKILSKRLTNVSIIQILIDLGKKAGAYKVILSAAEKNVGFYEKCGLERKSVTMALYLDH